MSDKNPPKRQIEKPWAVYYFTFPLIVKIVQDTKEGLDVMDSENVEYLPLIYLGHKNLVRFDTPSEAIEYSCKTYGFSKEKITKEFLDKFPSEKKDLQRLVAQSRLRLTDRVLEQKDEGPFGPHPYKKDDGFVHPNKKY